MIVTSRIKTRILSLAFNGLLVGYSNKSKQNTILDRIHNEQKAYNPVLDGERLVSVPSYWNWSRLAYLTYNHGQTIPIDDFCYIDVGTLDNVHHRLAAKENHVTAKEAPSRARKIIEFEDVLYSTVRPYLHNICIVDKEFSKTPIASTAFCVMHARKEVLLYKFLFYWLLTSEFDKYSNGDPSKGALYPAIGEKDLLNGVIPVPSIEEQALIVERIDAAFSALDTIDTLQSQYQDNLATLKSKIIDAGIQGKLTEQLPEDGNAEELYQQIQQEKAALEKAGKIKKSKPLPPVTEEEKAFEIPESWKWVRLGTVANSIYAGGDKPDDFSKFRDNLHYIPVVGNSIENEGILGYTEKPTAKAYTVTVAGRGTIGYSVFRAYEYCPVVRLIVIEQNTSIDPRYIQYVLQALPESGVGSSIPQLTVPMLTPKAIPLPPLAEQKRIVAKLEELLPLCEG